MKDETARNVAFAALGLSMGLLVGQFLIRPAYMDTLTDISARLTKLEQPK